MPSYRKDKKKWIARKKRGGVEFFLGYYHTRKEAEEIEHLWFIDWVTESCTYECDHPELQGKLSNKDLEKVYLI